MANKSYAYTPCKPTASDRDRHSVTPIGPLRFKDQRTFFNTAAMTTSMQDTISIIRRYTREPEGFASFFIMHIPTAGPVLDRYGLTSPPRTAAQRANSLAAVAQILKQDTTTTGDSFKPIKYDTATVYFERLAKHLDTGGTTSAAEMELLDSCFNEWRKVIGDVIGEAEDLPR